MADSPFTIEELLPDVVTEETVITQAVPEDEMTDVSPGAFIEALEAAKAELAEAEAAAVEDMPNATDATDAIIDAVRDLDLHDAVNGIQAQVEQMIESSHGLHDVDRSAIESMPTSYHDTDGDLEG